MEIYFFALSNYSWSWFKFTLATSLYIRQLLYGSVLGFCESSKEYMKQSICQHDQDGFWFKGCCKTPPKYYKLQNTFICLETFVGDGLKSPLRDYKVDQVFFIFLFFSYWDVDQVLLGCCCWSQWSTNIWCSIIVNVTEIVTW